MDDIPMEFFYFGTSPLVHLKVVLYGCRKVLPDHTGLSEVVASWKSLNQMGPFIMYSFSSDTSFSDASSHRCGVSSPARYLWHWPQIRSEG